MTVSLQNLADLYIVQGKYSKAEPLLKRALSIYENKFGENSIEIVKILEEIMLFYEKSGNEKKVESLRERLGIIRTK
jgi:tetratricopeptide (TPR) repeat protein